MPIRAQSAYNGLGRRDPDDEHRIVERYLAPVEMRFAERHRLELADEEDETKATGDVVLDEYLRRHRSGF